MRALLLCFFLAGACLLGGCGDETVYDWQRPHDTYQVGSFSKADNANALKAKLGQNGFECRIETEIKNGQFVLNVLVDVYDRQPDTMTRLERIAGVKPLLRERTPAKTAAPAGSSPAPAVPASGI
ncbi:MAG TPA: SPOR domain-containing protein [Solidesulfovibrio magneticus]|nr:SPOR domain-containing protein [Solidesulfovibrio magneticus]